MTSPMLAQAKLEMDALYATPPKGDLGTGLGTSAHARTNPYVELNESAGICHVYWGAYDYQIPLDEIATPEAALGWVQQMGEKTWRLMTPERIALFISIIADRNGWRTR